MIDKKVKVAVMLGLVFLAVGSPAFATASVKVASGTGGTTIDLSFVKNAVNLIVGVFAGGYCLLKAALDIFHAVRNSSEDQNGLKKAIGGFVLNAAILGGFMFVINYVFSSMSGLKADTDINSTTATEGFYGALSGALVSIGL